MQVELRVNANGNTRKTDVPEWLDDDFLQLCMQSGEGDPTIRVMNHKTSVFRHAKNNYSPVMYRVSVEFKRRPRSRNILDFKPQEVRWLIIKMITHSSESPETGRKSIVFDKEITALSTTIPSISKAYGVFPLAAQCFYSERSPRALVVMEDLAKNDFLPGKMERIRGLDYDHCTLVLRSMAALHAGSIAVCEKNLKMSIENCHPSNMYTEEDNSLIKDIVDIIIPDIADEIASWPNFGDKYADRVRALKNNFPQRLSNAVKRNTSGFNVLNHGHCWYNNLLFRYNNATRTVEDVLFVDFQESIFTSPVIDLQHFLYSSPTDEVRLQNFNRLLQFYHRELVSNLDKLKVKTKPPTKEELIKEMDSRGAYSVWVAFTLLPIILDDSKTSTGILRDPNASKERRKMYSNEQYKASMKRLLQIFDTKGLLD